MEFEFDTCLRCTAMSAQKAREFFGGEFFRVVCTGQAIGAKYRFGARHYKLFRTEAAYNQHQAQGLLDAAHRRSDG